MQRSCLLMEVKTYFKFQSRASLSIFTYSMEQIPSSWPVFCQPRNSLRFTEPEGSLPYSQVSATCPHLEPARSSPYLHIHFMIIHLNIILPYTLGLPSGLFPSGYPTKTLYTPLLTPIRATCTAHLILLYLITRTIFREKYRYLSSPLCSFLH